MNRYLIFPATATLLLSTSGSAVAQGSATAVNGPNAHAPPLGSSQQEVDYTDHFRVFTGDGEPASLEDIMRAMVDMEAVLIGESHTDPVGHWIQADLLREALVQAAQSDAPRPVALSLEMFERDVQGIVDEYLQDLITEEQFKASARPWKFYDADYRPMVELAKETGIPVIAANAPRRYVNRVTRLGRNALDDLPSYGRSFLPPLPYPHPSDVYREEWLSLMGEMPMERTCETPVAARGNVVADSQDVERHRPAVPVQETPPVRPPSHMASFMENGVHAQALWDASMAHAITSFLELNPGGLVLHMVGGFHVENFTGIPEQVQHYRPGTRSLVLSMDIADDFRSFDPEEHAGLGDFVILTDKSLDQDYARNCAGEQGAG